MSKVLQVARQGKIKPATQADVAGLKDLDMRIALIQTLIPLGLQAVEEVLQQEFMALVGPRYARSDGRPHLVRWGQQLGSVYLADQKLPILVPRVRNRQADIEVPLQTRSTCSSDRKKVLE